MSGQAAIFLAPNPHLQTAGSAIPLQKAWPSALSQGSALHYYVECIFLCYFVFRFSQNCQRLLFSQPDFMCSVTGSSVDHFSLCDLLSFLFSSLKKLSLFLLSAALAVLCGTGFSTLPHCVLVGIYTGCFKICFWARVLLECNHYYFIHDVVFILSVK